MAFWVLHKIESFNLSSSIRIRENLSRQYCQYYNIQTCQHWQCAKICLYFNVSSNQFHNISTDFNIHHVHFVGNGWQKPLIILTRNNSIKNRTKSVHKHQKWTAMISSLSFLSKIDIWFHQENGFKFRQSVVSPKYFFSDSREFAKLHNKAGTFSGQDNWRMLRCICVETLQNHGRSWTFHKLEETRFPNQLRIEQKCFWEETQIPI